MTYSVEYMNAMRAWAAVNGSSVPPEVTAAPLEQHEAAEQQQVERLRAAAGGGARLFTQQLRFRST